jgi:hypothetical protein
VLSWRLCKYNVFLSLYFYFNIHTILPLFVILMSESAQTVLATVSPNLRFRKSAYCVCSTLLSVVCVLHVRSSVMATLVIAVVCM